MKDLVATLAFSLVLVACGGGDKQETKPKKGDSCEQLTKCCAALPKDYDSTSAKLACSEPREQDLICWVHLSDVRDSFYITSYEKWPMPAVCKSPKS